VILGRKRRENVKKYEEIWMEMMIEKMKDERVREKKQVHFPP
jgi:hypothetical protein